jgi:transposase InsO family protein
MKYVFIQKHRSEFAVEKMCQVLAVSRSGYYAWIDRPESQRSLANKVLVQEIKQIHKDSRKTYGSPRIADSLHDLGYSCSRPRVARLMKANGIKAKAKRRYKVTTDSNHDYPFAPNLLGQDFWVDTPNRVWVGDITYLKTWKGWLYLTVILDLFHRKVVGWSMSDRLTAHTTTIPAFMQAVKRYQPLPGLIFHSDRGVQYACDDFRDLLKAFKVIQSMSGKGNCYDNAVAESFFHTLKTELVYHETYRTRAEAKTSLFEYIEVFYNRIRKHSYLGYKSPEQYEQLNYKQAV